MMVMRVRRVVRMMRVKVSVETSLVCPAVTLAARPPWCQVSGVRCQVSGVRGQVKSVCF